MRDNGVDLVGNLPGRLREPLAEPSEAAIVYPDDDYPTLQHAVDALRPGGELTLREGPQTAGVTLAKELTLRAQNEAEVALQARSSDAAGLSLVEGAALSAEALEVTGGNDGLVLGADAEAKIRDSAVSENENTGIRLFNSAKATIRNSTVSEHGFDGIVLVGSAQVEIRDSTVSENEENGIELFDSTRATIRENEITGNNRGVVLVEPDCSSDADESFTGVVEGGANAFDGNAEGAVCPSPELDFLMTEEGGELDRRD